MGGPTRIQDPISPPSRFIDILTNEVGCGPGEFTDNDGFFSELGIDSLVVFILTSRIRV
jgi:hypothetical protein